MDNRDKDLLVEFKNRLPSDIRVHVKQIIAYGSRARGDALPDSDLDVVALVDDKTPELESRIDDVVYQVMWDHDFHPIISIMVFSESRFLNAFHEGWSFNKNVMSDGIRI